MDLKSYLPPFLLDSEILNYLFVQYQAESDNLDDNTQDLLNQLFPQTATWALKYWEQMCGIAINESLDIIVRRNKVLAVISAYNPVSPYVMKNLLKHFAQDAEIIQDFANYSFTVNLITTNMFNFALDDIINSIETNKPAHLNYSLGLRNEDTIKINSSYIVKLKNYLLRCNTFYCGSQRTVEMLKKLYKSTISMSGSTEISTTKYSIFCGDYECGSDVGNRMYSSLANINGITINYANKYGFCGINECGGVSL